MKLTKPPLKVKVNRENLLSLLNYLNHIHDYKSEYLNPLIKSDKFIYIILAYNLESIIEKVINTIYKNHHKTPYKTNLQFNEAERLTLIKLAIYYPLPLDIEFINYELQKNLIL